MSHNDQTISSVSLIILSIMVIGCSTTQEKAISYKSKHKNTMTVTVDGDVDNAKRLVREVAEDLKLIERKYGGAEVKIYDEQFLLVSNNRLKSGLGSLIFGSIGTIFTSPANLGVFFEYDEKTDTTMIILTEQKSWIGLPRRFKIADKILEKANLYKKEEIDSD